MLYMLIGAIIFGNDIVPLLKETLKYSIIPLSYFITESYFLYQKDTSCKANVLDRLSIFMPLSIMVISFQIIRLIIFLSSEYGVLRYGVIMDILPSCYFAALLLSKQRKLVTIGAIGLLCSAALLLPIDKDMLVVLFLLICPCLIIIDKVFGFKNMIKMAFVGGCILAVVVILFFVAMSFNVDNNNEMADSHFAEIEQNADVEGVISENSRIDRFKNFIVDAASPVRFQEVAVIIEEMRQSSWRGRLFGLGGGATFRLDHIEGADVFYNRDRHGSHISAAALYLRHGVVGLLFYFGIFLSILWLGLRALKCIEISSKDQINYVYGKLGIRFAIYYNIASFAGSWMVFGFVDDCMIGISLAIVLLLPKYFENMIEVEQKPQENLVIFN